MSEMLENNERHFWGKFKCEHSLSCKLNESAAKERQCYNIIFKNDL
jgi:hypothetical protein